MFGGNYSDIEINENSIIYIEMKQAARDLKSSLVINLFKNDDKSQTI